MSSEHQSNKENISVDKSKKDAMLSFAPAPIFKWDSHRPSMSSPLSSSPTRAPSSPISPEKFSTSFQRQTQSSPIPAPKFRFATRPTRPNPRVLSKREDVQEVRRRNFLESVKRKSDDSKWERRNIEGQFLKKSYYEGLGQLAQDAPELSEADIQDAMSFSRPPQSDDAIMMDEPPEEDVDYEAMLASYEEQQQQPAQQPTSPASSDADYDDIFAELIAQEQRSHHDQTNVEQGDYMDEDNIMSY
ncbi:uncharacterized protein F5Z01DRAFT_638736 [Emericellopsis atlantica]|uniref:Uncharacterized protein n=1 Tax=Emericellopsis atlantica TaxID=2614577 RepID=A0A9P7ZHB3_9HYPO|nr:uncharacterized protein F5Z01DRAFT_638736 [Emericellopsis atlantica]KAG9252099.1 hypothetical protein F5Z01DRAFT_638736 [Emericellopsis atlantica]